MVSPTRSWISSSTTISSTVWGAIVETKARSERRGRAFMTIESGSEEHAAFCRDRGWTWRGRGGLVPVLHAGTVRWCHENRDESDGEEGQAQGPRPSVSGGNEDRHKAPAHPHRPPPVPTDGGEVRWCYENRGVSGGNEDRHKAPAHPHRPPPVPTDGGEGRCERRGSSGSEE